jgi:hypothetical protein
VYLLVLFSFVANSTLLPHSQSSALRALSGGTVFFSFSSYIYIHHNDDDCNEEVSIVHPLVRCASACAYACVPKRRFSSFSVVRVRVFPSGFFLPQLYAYACVPKRRFSSFSVVRAPHKADRDPVVRKRTER